ncbi:MAG: leucine-rich repeat protein [Ruminococcus sp.]|nr:leucine-rich repeat protein [Ruminococcus sp.]
MYNIINKIYLKGASIMKVTNRIISAVTAVCMASAPLVLLEENIQSKHSRSITLTANAEEYITENGLKLEYEERDENSVEIIKYISSSSTDIEIPSTIDGKEVRGISWEAFTGCSGITSIIIPENVDIIDMTAFSDCSSLKSITIKNPDCTIYTPDYSDPISDDVTIYGYIYSSAQEYAELHGKKFEILSDANNNGEFWFYDLPDGNIEIRGFTSSSATYLEIPSVIDGKKVTSIGAKAFEYFYNLRAVKIPDGVININDGAFASCNNLRAITIPDSVTSIGAEAFNYCSQLREITIPNGVTSIGTKAFNYCSQLKEITIPNSVTSIGDEAFSYCGLKSITIPENVTTIGTGVFNGCRSLSEINVSENNSYYSDINGVLFDKAQSQLICHPIRTSYKEYAIPDSVTSIGSYAFNDCYPLTSITIPDSVTEIADHAFYGCSGLTSMTIPDSVASIGIHAFSDCSNMTSIILPNNITSISNGTFFNCDNLASITIPDSVTSIEWCAFSGCKSLTSANIPKSITAIEKRTFEDCQSLKSVTLPDGVTSIGTDAFTGCHSLTSITIPDSVTAIGGSSFSDCISLTAITLPESVASIEYGAFENCSELISITIKNPDCEIYDSKYTICNGRDNDNRSSFYNGIIYGYSGSTAQEYAEKYGRTFSALNIKGDVNDDGSFNIADIVNMQKWLLNNESELVNWKNGDLYEDDMIDTFDLVLMRKMLIQ